MDSIKDMLPFLIPVAVLELGLMVFALIDLIRRTYVRGGNKVVWVLVIILINLIGPIVYLVFGRVEEPVDSD